MADLPPRITTLDGQTVQTPHVVMYKGSSPKQLANFNSTNGCYHVIDTVLAPKANVAPPPPPPQPSPAEVAAAFRGQKFQATGANPNNGSGGASDNGGDSARVAALERELAQVKA